MCALLEDISLWINIDEGMHVFTLHGIGGIVGSLLTGIFASRSGKPLLFLRVFGAPVLSPPSSSIVSMLDGMTSAPGAVDGNGLQIAKQLADISAISAYSFVVSAVILLIMKHLIPGLDLRLPESAEISGLDSYEFWVGETTGSWALHGKGLHVLEGVEPSAGSIPPPPAETVQQHRI